MIAENNGMLIIPFLLKRGYLFLEMKAVIVNSLLSVTYLFLKHKMCIRDSLNILSGVLKLFTSAKIRIVVALNVHCRRLLILFFRVSEKL